MRYYRIGVITRPHGVNGAVKLTPLSDNPERYRELGEAYIERGGGVYEPVAVSNVGVRPDAVYLNLSGVGDMDAAERLRGLYLCVDKAHAVKLPQGEYFVADLIGCTVSDTDGNAYGTLVDVLETGSADVYVIKGKKTLMVPALKRLLKEVDTEKGSILLDKTVLGEVGLFED